MGCLEHELMPLSLLRDQPMLAFGGEEEEQERESPISNPLEGIQTQPCFVRLFSFDPAGRHDDPDETFERNNTIIIE